MTITVTFFFPCFEHCSLMRRMRRTEISIFRGQLVKFTTKCCYFPLADLCSLRENNMRTRRRIMMMDIGAARRVRTMPRTSLAARVLQWQQLCGRVKFQLKQFRNDINFSLLISFRHRFDILPEGRGQRAFFFGLSERCGALVTSQPRASGVQP